MEEPQRSGVNVILGVETEQLRPVENDASATSRARVFAPRYAIVYRNAQVMRGIEFGLWPGFANRAKGDVYGPITYSTMQEPIPPTRVRWSRQSGDDSYDVEWTRESDSAAIDQRLPNLIRRLSTGAPGQDCLRSVAQLIRAAKHQPREDLVYPSLPIAIFGRLSISDGQSIALADLHGKRSRVAVSTVSDEPIKLPRKLLEHVAYVLGVVKSLEPIVVDAGAVFF